MSAVLPTPGPPSMLTRYESTGPVDEREGIGCDGEWLGDIGLVARLLLRERFRRNESPRLITPGMKNNETKTKTDEEVKAVSNFT